MRRRRNRQPRSRLPASRAARARRRSIRQDRLPARRAGGVRRDVRDGAAAVRRRPDRCGRSSAVPRLRPRRLRRLRIGCPAIGGRLDARALVLVHIRPRVQVRLRALRRARPRRRRRRLRRWPSGPPSPSLASRGRQDRRQGPRSPRFPPRIRFRGRTARPRQTPPRSRGGEAAACATSSALAASSVCTCSPRSMMNDCWPLTVGSATTDSVTLKLFSRSRRWPRL